MRRTIHVLLAAAAVVLALLVDWPQRKRQITRLARLLQEALSQPFGGDDAMPNTVPPLQLNNLHQDDAGGSKLLTLPRLWLASAVVIILTAIALRPLLP